jgi:hypothetical protein
LRAGRRARTVCAPDRESPELVPLTEPDSVHATHARRFAVVLVAILVSSCGGDGPAALIPQPGITVVASPTTSDTVQANPVQALILVVADSTGAPAAGVVVRLEGARSSAPRHGCSRR